MGAEFGSAENTCSKSPLKAIAECSGSAEAIHPEKGIWKSRTALEKHLLAIIVLLCLVTAVLLSAIILLVVLDVDKSMATENGTSIHNGPQNYDGSGGSSKKSTLGRPTKNLSTHSSVTSKPQNSNACSTPGCKIASAYMIEAMNVSVNPCENFFEFACGQWNDRHPIPNDMPGFDTYAYVEEQVSKQLRVLLEKDVKSDSKSVNMARAIYRSCMNETQLEELKTAPIFETLNELGEWPVLQEQWDKTKFNLTNILINSHRHYGSSAFFSIFVTADFKNLSRQNLFIDQSNLSLGTRDFYLNTIWFSRQMAAYKKYLINIAQLLKTDGNLTRSEAEINVDIDKMIAFETEIAKEKV